MGTWSARGPVGVRNAPPYAPTAKVWLFVGDSLSATSSIDWVTQMTPRIPAGISVVNVATTGNNSAQIMAQWRTYAQTATPLRVFVLGGINDIRIGTSAATSFASLSFIYADAAARGVSVIALPTLPFGLNVNWTAGRQTELLALRTSIQGASVSQVIDLYTPMGQSGLPEQLATAYDSGDGLHPNNVGALNMANTVATALGL